MKKMRKRIHDNYSFFFPYFIYLIIGALFLSITKKGDILLLINEYHNPFFDIFFKYATMLGEGYYFAVIIIIMGMFRFKYFLEGLILFLATGAVAQILKHIVNDARPISYFANSIHLNLVDGVSVYQWYSMPSGHSTSAFTIYLFFAMISKNEYVKFVYFLLALIVAISRVYLAQHFFADVYVGSLLGVILTLFIHNYSESSIILNRTKWYNYQLINTKSNVL